MSIASSSSSAGGEGEGRGDSMGDGGTLTATGRSCGRDGLTAKPRTRENDHPETAGGVDALDWARSAALVERWTEGAGESGPGVVGAETVCSRATLEMRRTELARKAGTRGRGVSSVSSSGVSASLRGDEV